MKRILIFSLTYHPFVGGAEVAIKEITDRIRPTEYAFDMITLRFDRRLPRVEKVGNVTVHRIGWSVRGATVSDRSMPLRCKLAKALFPLTAFWKALRLQRHEQFDMVWAMMANQAAFASLFFKLVHPRVPYFLELQDGRALADMKTRRPILRVLWWLYRAVYLRADTVKCISQFIAREVRGIGYSGRVEIIPNAVDVAKFSAPVPEKKLNELRERFGKVEGDVFLFTASRLVLSRGVEDVIESLVHLPPRVKFLIAGAGDDREKLEHIARGLGVSERVVFAGHVSHDDLPAYLKISDIFVRPSIIEGFGNAFVEAFAAGTPVVATPVGGIPDFLFDPERLSTGQGGNSDVPPTGLFCEVRNPESIARAVQRYLDDPSLAAWIVANAQELVAKKYDWNLIARDMRNRIFAPMTGI